MQRLWLILLGICLLIGSWIIFTPSDPQPASSFDPGTRSSFANAQEPRTSSTVPASSTGLGPAPTSHPATQSVTQRHFEYPENRTGIAVATQPLLPGEYSQDRTHPIQQAVLFQINPQKILDTHRAGQEMDFPLFDLGDVRVKFDEMTSSGGVTLADGTVRSAVAMNAGDDFSLGISGSTVSGRFTIGQRQFVMYTGPLGFTLAEVDPYRMPKPHD